MDAEDRPVNEQLRFDRRSLLRGAGAAGLTFTGADLLAACGSSSSSSSGSSSTGGAAGSKAATGTPRQGGSLRIGMGGGGSQETLDPENPNDSVTTVVDVVVYDQLTQIDNDFKFRQWLTEFVEPNHDATEWTIRVKQGIEFHNGKTLDADDVIFTIQRIMKAPGAAALGAVDPKGFKKLDSRTVRVGMLKPYSVFDIGLGDGGAAGVVPVGFNYTRNPIGTGAFKVKSFTPGQQVVLERFENYWGHRPYLDELVFTEIADDNARVNALLTGEVDVINSVPAAQIPNVQSRSGLDIYESKTGAFAGIYMNCAVAPFDDVRVRQAIRLALDRHQILLSAASGHGTLASDLYARYDAGYPADLVREQDLEQARSLLKAAGMIGKSVELVVAPVFNGIVQACTAVAENVSKTGFTVNVRQVDVPTLFGPNNGHWAFTVNFWPALTFMSQAGQSEIPGPLLETHFNDPQFTALYNQAAAQVDEGKRVELIGQMQKILFDTGGWLIPYFPNSIDAHTSKVQGWPQQDLTGVTLGRGRFEQVYFTA